MSFLEAGDAEAPAFPAARSDQVAERGLACCLALLTACPVTAPKQLINLLQRFGAVAALARHASTEEVNANFPCSGPSLAEIQRPWPDMQVHKK